MGTGIAIPRTCVRSVAYARKALVFAHEAGLARQLDVVHQETSPTARNEQVFAENPLGKVPVLIRATPLAGETHD